ncbi:hypothetical protein [Bradyrhizobium sp. CIR3A]|nr:hypothetical protein [Bradyrhizobium sp. CIR3A]MBB4264009.1 hypothetical protein [Bradyrhizobium sp. CIR3A]
MRERLGLPEYDPSKSDGKFISLAKAAERLGACPFLFQPTHAAQ